MVFESLVTNLMNKYLSQFVDELTAKQLHLGAWSGSLSLANIAIKANAFDSLALPFRVTHGHIGLIEASIPWKSLYSSPVVVKLSDVYVVALPNTDTKYDEQSEALIEWNNKKSQLSKIEEAKQRSQTSVDETVKSDDNFATKLAAQIIKNLQVVVTNVHICYEDRLTWKEFPFQVGLTLRKLRFQTTEPTTQTSNSAQNSDNVIYKLAALEGFALYWNCSKFDPLSRMESDQIDKILRLGLSEKRNFDLQYILSPIEFSTNLTINRKPELESYQTPAVDVNMDLDTFELRVSRKQFELMLLLLDSIDRMNIAQPYRKWRPTEFIKGNSKLWWNFAFIAILETNVRRRQGNWSWSKMKAHRIKMQEYQDLYKQKLLGKKVEVEVENLEKQLNLTSIVLARSNAELEAQQYQLINKDTKKGWFSWWKKDDNVKEGSIIRDFKKEMTATEKANLYKTIGYEENIPHELPKDFVAHKLLFVIKKIKLIIHDNYSDITQLLLNTVLLKVSHRPSSQGIKVSTCVKSIAICGIENIPLLEEQKSSDVLTIKFDLNPLSNEYDYGVNMKMSAFKLIYDANTINKLIEVFSPPKDISLNELQAIAAIKIYDWSQKTATGLEFAISKHKQLKLNIDFEPSYVIVPKLGQLSEAETILLISLGHLNISSNLIPRSEMPKVRELFESHTEHDLILKMRKMAYESYTCCISDVQVILSDRDHWQQDLQQSATSRHLLYPVMLNVTIDRCIITNDPHLAKLIIKGELPNIEVKISDQQISKLFNLLMTLPIISNDNQLIEQSDEIDSGKKYIKRDALPINSNQIMVDAMNFAKQTVSQIEEKKKVQILNANDIDTNKQIIAYKDMIFEFKLKQISISLFSEIERESKYGLAFAQLIKFEIYGELLTDSSMWINCLIGDLLLTDIRTTRSETGIKNLLYKNLREQNITDVSNNSRAEKDTMFSLILTQKADERFIEISMSGFRLIFALDYLLNLSNIVTKSLDTSTLENESVDKTVASKKSDKKDQTKTEHNKQPKSSAITVINFNLSQVDIVLLESIEITNAPAIILCCQSTIHMKQKTNFLQLSGQVSDISMILTNYERYTLSQDIDAYIMRPTDLSVNGTINGDRQMFDISFSDIRIFISPPMVNVVVNILSKMGSSAEVEKTETQKSLNLSDLFKPRPNDTTKWYLSYVAEADEMTEEFVSITEDEPKPVKVPDQQQVFLNIQSISITLESGGSDSQPLIKLDSYFTGKLMGYKILSLNSSLIANYYNENNFSWEPLIEPIEGKPNPWDFNVDLTLDDNGKTSIKFESNDQLELTITKTSIAILTSLNEAFAHAVTKQEQTRDENVILVRNYLGIDLKVILNDSSLKVRSDNIVAKSSYNRLKVDDIKVETLIIKSGHEVPLYTTDLKVVDLIISLVLDDETEVNRHIKCFGHTLRCYNLPKKSYPTGEYWKFLVEVENVDAFTKAVTFKSIAEIINKFNTSLDVYQHNLLNNEFHFIGRIKPLLSYYLPLTIVYSENSLLKVTPSEDYKICDQTIDWRNLAQQTDRRLKRMLTLPLCDSSANRKTLILECESKNNSKHIFFIKVKGESVLVNFEETNAPIGDSLLHQVRLMPIVKIRNLLPFVVSCTVAENIDKFTLNSGDDSDLPNVKLGETDISLTVNNYMGSDWSCSKKLPATGSDNELQFWSFTSLENAQQLNIDLAVKLSIEDSFLVMTLFAPFWMINKTDKQLIYRVDDRTLIFHPPALKTPVLLSFKPKSFFCKKKLSMAIGDSKFSDGFSIDVVGSRGNVIAKSKTDKYQYCASIEIVLSRIGLTKIVTITPFYIIINASLKVIEFSEDNDEWISVSNLTKHAFWPKRNKDPIIYFRLDSESVSSKALSLRESSTTLVRVGGDYINIDVDITEWEATIKISDYYEGSAPVLLINALRKPIIYGQKDIQHQLNLLPPFHSVLYTWYDPSTYRKLVWKYDDYEQQLNELKCDSLDTIHDIHMVSFLDSKQRILLFTDDFLLASNALQAGEITHPKIQIEFIMKGIGLSLVNNLANKEILYIAITSSVIWEFREVSTKRFKPVSAKSNDALESSYQRVILDKRVGKTTNIVKVDSYQIDFTDSFNQPKLLAPKSGKLRRLSNRGIWLSLSMSEHFVQCHIKIHRLQIDNQIPDCIFGIVMCPIAPPKTIAADQTPRSFIEFSTLIQRQATMNRYKSVSILIQEFLIQVDRGLLVSVQELFGDVIVKKYNNNQLIEKDLRDIIKDSIISVSLASRKSYYDMIHFSPLKVHLSFSLGGSSGGQLPPALDFFIRSAGVTLTEFNDVLFKLNYFDRKNILVDDSELISLVTKHYTAQVLKQFYVLVLGLDVIGNPMKLVLGLQQGVGDFFYEPFQGIIQGPEEFAEGMALGVKSLASNVLGGVSGALGSITGTLGEGVSALTLDDKFRRERRSRLNQKTGFAESAKSLFRGVFAGVSGVITQPIEGAKEEGFEGLMKGMGRGVVGIVAQPTTGIIDFASGSLNAFKRAIDPKQEAKKMRPTRHFSEDNILRPYKKQIASTST